MKTVAPHPVVLVPAVGQGVDKGVGGHGLVPGGVHDGAVGNLGQHGPRRFDSRDVGRIVQRCQVGQCLEGVESFPVDDHRLGELLSAVYDPMSHRLDLVEVVNRSDIRIGQSLDNQLESHLVVGTIFLLLVSALAFGVVLDERTAHGYPLHDTFGQNFPAVPVVQLVFQRGTPAV